MPAYLNRSSGRPRERAYALAAVVIVQFALGFALLTGLRVQFVARSTSCSNWWIALPPPQPPPTPPTPEPKRAKDSVAPKPKAAPGRFAGPQARPCAAVVTPIVAVQPTAAPSGGGTGTGPALGSGAGGGAGGQGYGAGGGGMISNRSPAPSRRGLSAPSCQSGHRRDVECVFTVGVNGRVARCTVTRSSGVPELDALTCRLVEQRFVYRPAPTVTAGRVPEVEGEHRMDAGD